MTAISGALQNIPLLSRLSDSQLDAVAGISERCRFTASQEIVLADTPAEAAYYLIDGAVDCLTESAEGEVTKTPIPPGATLLELAMIVEIDVSASCVARGPVKMIRIPRAEMHELMQTDAPLTDAIIETLTLRLRDMAETMREASLPFEELKRA